VAASSLIGGALVRDGGGAPGRYNIKSDNLAEHGIHPRATHLLVNLPMLYGPLAALAAYSTLRGLVTWQERSADGVGGERAGGGSPGAEVARVRGVVASCAASGLVWLSLAPHQVCLYIYILFIGLYIRIRPHPQRALSKAALQKSFLRSVCISVIILFIGLYIHIRPHPQTLLRELSVRLPCGKPPRRLPRASARLERPRLT